MLTRFIRILGIFLINSFSIISIFFSLAERDIDDPRLKKILSYPSFFEDRFYDEQFFLDFNATVFLSRNLQVYANLNNITNQPLRYYQGARNRTMQMEYYSTRLTFGVKYDLF